MKYCGGAPGLFFRAQIAIMEAKKRNPIQGFFV